MQSHVRPECPKCSRPLQNFNGHIGYCPQHKWVSPIGAGFDAEAAEQNRQDAALAEQRRLEQERQRAEAEAQERRRQHQGAVRVAVIVALAVLVIAAAVVFFIVRPSLNYSNAGERFDAGDYSEALRAYSALGDYRDSASRVTLCEAMIALQEGRYEDAMAELDALTGSGAGEITDRLSGALLPIVENWQSRGLTPQLLLMLLDRVDIIDPDGTLDTVTLSTQAHAALLDGAQLGTYVQDLDGDGRAELIALAPDGSLSAYRMTADGNTPFALDNGAMAACYMQFGQQLSDSNPDAALNCYARANSLAPGDDTRAALSGAYRQRATAHENAGDWDAAVADARSALEVSASADDFSFFYELNLRRCRNGQTSAGAIALWDEFADNAAAELARFSATGRWQADAAALHLAYAAELAAGQDGACLDELKSAADLGADVTSALADAEAHFRPGLTLTRLQLWGLELAQGDAAQQQQLQAELAEEIGTAVRDWHTLGIPAGDVLALFHIAYEQGVALDGIDRDGIYAEAAVAASGTPMQYSFVDWDGDGWQELLALDDTGTLALYGMDGSWQALSSVGTGLASARYTIADEAAPLILLLSPAQDELWALSSDANELQRLFREQGICRYAANGTEISFSRLLEGSIERYEDYSYTASGTAARPVRTGVDWQQNSYPEPESAAAALQRWFEARAYDIPEEAALLSASQPEDGFFSPDALAALPAPDVPGTVEAAPYLVTEGRELFEVSYTSGTQHVRGWVCVGYGEGWKLLGAADSYGSGLTAGDVYFSLPLLGLNVEATDTISQRGGRMTWRVLVPSAGRLTLSWQSGSKAAQRTSHTVSLLQGSLTGDTVFSYPLQPSPNMQQSRDMFVSAGVYCLSVEANINDAEPFSLTLRFAEETNVELENNDTPATATPIQTDTVYSASLSDGSDVDFFSFTLTESGAVNLSFVTSGSGDKLTTYSVSLLNGTDGGTLNSFDVPGNAQRSESGRLFLSPGNYAVRVAKGRRYTNEPYTLSVNVAREGNMEAEPNDVPERANAIPLNEDISATIGKEGDVDCYSFTLDAPAVIQPQFSFAPLESSSRTYVLTITDAARHELLRADIRGRETSKVIAPVALSAGSYGVKIENPNYIRQEYTLRLVSMAVDAAELEPNDTAALATPLNVDAPVSGVLTTDADADWYLLKLDAPAVLNLRFAFTRSTDTHAAFRLSIEQNGASLWSADMTGDSGGTWQTIQFPAGEYYFRLRPSSHWLSAVYTLGVNRAEAQ